MSLSYQGSIGVMNSPKRTIGIAVPGHDSNNMRKHLTGTTSQFFAKDSKGNEVPVGSPYEVAEALPQLPASGLLDIHRELDFGMRLDRASLQVNSDGTTYLIDPDPISFLYKPLVTQLFYPDEHYQWIESLNNISASADLPRTVTVQYPAWTIEDVATTYRQPVIRRWNDSVAGGEHRLYENGNRGQDDRVSLRYEWADGLTADASVTTHLHQAPADDWKLLGLQAEILDNEPFVNEMNFVQGEDDRPNSGDGFWSITGNLNAQNVIVQPAGINWIQAESAAAVGFVVAEMFAPEAVGPFLGFGSAILGEATNFTPAPSAGTEPWAYGGPNGLAGTPDQCDAVITYWNTQGRVRQPDYLDRLPHLAGEHPCTYARWHVYGQPQTITQYYLGDKWGPNGYEGQTIQNVTDESRNVHKSSPLRGNVVYDFDFPSLHPGPPPPHGDPPFNPPGPTPDPGPNPSGGGAQ